MTEPTHTIEFEDEIRAVMDVPPARDEFVNKLNTRLIQHSMDAQRSYRPGVYTRPG